MPHICQRKRLFKDQSIGDCVGVLERSAPIRLAVCWWNIYQFVIHEDHSAYVHFIGLTIRTYFFPRRILRQRGLRQTILHLGCIPSKSSMNNPTHVHSWMEYCLLLPLIIIPAAPFSANVSEFYIELITERNVDKRKDLQQKENTRASKGIEVREVKERGDLPQIGKKRIKDLTLRREPQVNSGKEVGDSLTLPPSIK